MNIQVGNKVKTKLQLTACPIVCQAKGEDYDYYDAYHKRWEVIEIKIDGFILKDKKGQIMKTDLNGYGVDDWFGHNIYKVTK